MKRLALVLLLVAVTVSAGVQEVWLAAAKKRPVPGADVTSGLVSQWKLDEASGTTATDAKGVQNGTIYNGSWSAGRLLFGGSTYINFSNNSTYNTPTTDFSTTCWVKFDQRVAQTLFWRGVYNSAGWYHEVNASGGIHWVVMYPGTGVFASAGNIYTVGDWQLITHSRSNQWYRIYRNGVCVLTYNSTHPEGNVSTDQPLVFGRYNSSSVQYFRGSARDLRFYNRNLLPDEVTTLYVNGPK